LFNIQFLYLFIVRQIIHLLILAPGHAALIS